MTASIPQEFTFLTHTQKKHQEFNLNLNYFFVLFEGMRISFFTLLLSLYCFQASSFVHLRSPSIVSDFLFPKINRDTTRRYFSDMQFVDKLQSISPSDGRKKRVSISDAIMITGQKEETVRKKLLQLVSLTHGTVELSKTGDVIYSYPSNLKQVVVKNSLLLNFISLLQSNSDRILSIFRSVFGIVMIGSFAIVSAGVLVLLSLLNSASYDDKDNDRRNRRRSSRDHFSVNFFNFPSTYNYCNSYSNHQHRSGTSFWSLFNLDSFSHFVFGDVKVEGWFFLSS